MNSNILQYLLESGGCLAAFYLLYLAALRKENSFQYNRFYLLIATLISFLLPLVKLPLLPHQAIGPLSPITSQLKPIVIYTTAGVTADANSIGWQEILLLAYTIGGCFFAFRLLRQVYALCLFIRHSKNKVSRWNGIKLIQTNGKLPTFSFLDYIFWDNSQQLNNAEQEQVLQHESVHVLQGHSYDMLYLEILHIIFWFNPLLLFYKKALISTHEFIADAQVLQTADKQEYAHLLAKQVCLKMEFSIGNFFNKSLTLKRMKMIQTKNHRTPMVKKILALPLLAGLLLVFSSNTLPVTETTANAAFQAKVSQVNQTLQGPGFPGGENELYKFLGKNLRYPSAAIRAATVGYVVLQATIDESGKVGNYKTLHSAGDILEKEVKRTLEKMPTWKPAQKDGKAISSTYLFSVNFGIKGEQGDEFVSTKPDLEEIANQVSAQSPNQPVFMAEELVVVGYGVKN